MPILVAKYRCIANHHWTFTHPCILSVKYLLTKIKVWGALRAPPSCWQPFAPALTSGFVPLALSSCDPSVFLWCMYQWYMYLWCWVPWAWLGMGKDWAQRTNIFSPMDYKYRCCAICDDQNRFSWKVKLPLQPAILQSQRHLLDLILWTTVWRATKSIDRWRHLCFYMVAPSINWFCRPSNCSSEYEIQQMALQL